MLKLSVALAVTFVSVFCLQPFNTVRAESDQGRLWEALALKNHFAMIRHAMAPGTGDPPEFVKDRRETQRNLSKEGRLQAKRIGDLFRSHDIAEALVYTSEWYRCRDTAELLNLGAVQLLPVLNSFFEDYGQKDAVTASLKDWLAQQKMDKPTVLVTHQVNITALTGVFPSSGEIVVVEQQSGGQIRVLGQIETRP